MLAMTTEKTPIATSRDEFLRNLAASGLTGVSELEAATALLAPEEAKDGPSVAAALAAAGRLTRFQADAVLAGRFADLRMGNYDILDRLGAGAMGTVFKARHRRMKRLVALKLLGRAVAQSENFVQRFQREVETIARLTHPNIVMAFDADECEAGLFLVMEFVDGRDLSSEVVKGGPLAIVDAIDYTVQAGRGLAYAHDHGLIHRDIKPANILRDVSGQVKVADLGLARLNDADHAGATSLTQAGGVLGTIDYMSPEQAVDSTAVDHRADQYSLGATLYYLLTGQSMFKGGSAMAVLLMHRDAPIPSLTAHRPDVPAELEAVFRKMVAKKADDRYPTMGDAIRALEAVPAVRPTNNPAARERPTSHGGPAELNFSFGSSSQSGLNDPTRIMPEGNLGPAVAGLVVVLAEASRTQAGIIRKFLEQLGITDVRVALSGTQAVEMARRAGVRVVFSSMHLKDMSGMQLAKMIHADPDLAELGFVLATSESDSDQVADLRGLARTVLIPKPFDLARLASGLAEAAGLSSHNGT
jgi:serine/threonine protein kinase